jgi:hypothetical protein
MTVALSPVLPASTIEHLIVADIAPSNASILSPEFQNYIEAMNKIEESKVSSRREAQDILAPYEPVGLFFDDGCIYFLNCASPLGPNYPRIPLDQPRFHHKPSQVPSPTRHHRCFDPRHCRVSLQSR